MTQHDQAVSGAGKAQYVTPTINVMDEEEVLKMFQITSAGSSWWLSSQGAMKGSF